MQIKISNDKQALGKAAANYTAQLIRDAIAQKGRARIVLSTGASQTETINALYQEEVDWSKLEIFHLDEYIGLPIEHPASFRKYLKERIVDVVSPRKFHYVVTEGDLQDNIQKLTSEIRKDSIDVALIGIGENSHIAFNDPPADFETEEAYMIVDLDDDCKKQQVGEGWYGSINDVPQQAVSMTVKQIMSCKHIVSCVPDKRKAKAIRLTLESEESNMIPATILRRHSSWALFLDRDSASELEQGTTGTL